MITITESPFFKGYNTSREYLKFLNHRSSQCFFVNFYKSKTTFVLFKHLIDNNNFDLITPINFPIKTDSKNFWKNELVEELYSLLVKTGCISFYIQTKNHIELEHPNPLIDFSRVRTNYYIDLTNQEKKNFFDRQARDSRQRLKTALSFPYKFITSKKTIEEFCKYYSDMANSKGFSKLYKYTNVQFQALLKNEMIDYLEIQNEEGSFLAGGIFARHCRDVDYLYGTSSKIINDSIRVLLFEASNYYKSTNKSDRIFLGGGISENDSLSDFKKRLGSKKHICTAIRGVSNLKVAEKLYGNKFSQDWFKKDFFPPYRK